MGGGKCAKMSSEKGTPEGGSGDPPKGVPSSLYSFLSIPQPIRGLRFTRAKIRTILYRHWEGESGKYHYSTHMDREGFLWRRFSIGNLVM